MSSVPDRTGQVWMIANGTYVLVVDRSHAATPTQADKWFKQPVLVLDTGGRGFLWECELTPWEEEDVASRRRVL